MISHMNLGFRLLAILFTCCLAASTSLVSAGDAQKPRLSKELARLEHSVKWLTLADKGQTLVAVGDKAATALDLKTLKPLFVATVEKGWILPGSPGIKQLVVIWPGEQPDVAVQFASSKGKGAFTIPSPFSVKDPLKNPDLVRELSDRISAAVIDETGKVLARAFVRQKLYARAPVGIVAVAPSGRSAIANVAGAPGKPDDVKQTIEVFPPGMVKSAFLPKQNAIAAILFAPDGQSLAVLEEKGRLLIWNTRGPDVKTRLTINGLSAYNYYNISPPWAFSPDSKILATAEEAAVNLWDVATSKKKGSLVPDGEITTLTFSPDGKTLAMGNSGRKVTLWTVDKGQRLATYGFPESTKEPAVFGLTFSADGKMLYAAVKDEPVIHAWDVVVQATR